MKALFSLFLAFFPLLASAEAMQETSEKQRYEYLTSWIELSERTAESVQATWHLKPDPGWHVYGETPGESGLPSTLTLQTRGATLGAFSWPTPKLFMVPVINLKTYGYDMPVAAKAMVNLTDAAPASLQFQGTYMMCNKHTGLCIPGQSTYTVALPTLAATPMNTPDATPQLPQETAIATQTEQITMQTAALTLAEATEKLPSVMAPEAPALPILLAMALLAGLILNLMPCVLPVLMLKARALIDHTNTFKQEVWAYVAGVQAAMAALAVAIVTLRSTGDALGWGFQLQNPYFVGILAAFMLLLALMFFGVLPLPHGAHDLESKAAKRGGLIGSFLTGLLVVAVSTPCTAPFMAVPVAAAMTQAPPVIFAILFAMGLGLALPFVLLVLFPRLMRFMPKSGWWNKRLQQFFGFPMLATALWLLWVLAKLQGINVAFGLTFALLLVALILWLHGWVRWAVGALALLAALSLWPNFQKPTWEKFTYQTIAPEAPTLVNVTADWCLTCKVTEGTLFSSKAFSEWVASHNVKLLKADWTTGDADITAYLESFGRAGVPLYVLYTPESAPKVLPQLPRMADLRAALERP